MSLTEVTLEGTLNADGTLDLDRKPTLPAGRVSIVLRQNTETTPPKEDWLEHLQRIRTEREAAGYPFMSEQETTSHIEWLREGDRIDDLLQNVTLGIDVKAL